MKKALLTVTFTILLLFSCLLQPTKLWAQTATAPAVGSGTIEIPYQIATLENLYWIAATDDVVSSPNRATRWSAHYIQTADIDAAATSEWFDGAGWLPIGTDIDNSFIGSYDGDGKTISNLHINRPDTPNVGLFGHVGNSEATTTISNLGLIDTEIKGARGTGSLVGRVTGQQNTKISKCYATGGSVTGDGATGGLVGSFNSYVENPAAAKQFFPIMSMCYANNKVSLSENTGAGKDKFGGLAGCAQKGWVENCYARGPVTANITGAERIGGLLGCIEFKGYVNKSYSTGSVTAPEGATKVGGLVGFGGEGSNMGEWEACFWDKDASGQTAEGVGLGQTTEWMKTISNYTGYNPPWDFENVWNISAGFNSGYPHFKDLPPPADEASILVISTQPVSGLSGYLLETQPVIEIRDADNQLIASDNSTVVIVAFASGAGGSLGGVLTATATSGVATFENLTLTGLAGEDYKLRFTAGEIESVDSEPVQIKVRGWGSLQVSGTIQPLVRPLYYETRTHTLTVTVYLDAVGELPEDTKLTIHVYNDDGESPILAGELLDQEAAEEQLTARIALTNGPLKTRHIITTVVKSEDEP
jgi:hypothetical protein